MKAKDLIKHLEKGIDKYGDDLEVFVEFPGMNYEDVFNVKDAGADGIGVEDLSKYPPNKKIEDWGEGTGLIRGFKIFGDDHVQHCG